MRVHEPAESFKKIRFLYAAALKAQSNLYAPRSETLRTALMRPTELIPMTFLDGLSLALAIALFIYLLVALLRAGRI